MADVGECCLQHVTAYSGPNRMHFDFKQVDFFYLEQRKPNLWKPNTKTTGFGKIWQLQKSYVIRSGVVSVMRQNTEGLFSQDCDAMVSVKRKWSKELLHARNGHAGKRNAATDGRSYLSSARCECDSLNRLLTQKQQIQVERNKAFARLLGAGSHSP